MIKDVVDTILNLVKAPPAPTAPLNVPPEAVIHPVPDATKTDVFAERLAAMANDPALQATPLVAGALELVGLEDIRDALGDAWEAVAERAKAVAEAELQLHLGEGDVYRYAEGFSFVVCFADLDKASATSRASTIAVKLKAKLILQVPEIAEVIGVEHFVADVDRAALRRGGTSLTERLLETLRQVRKETREATRRMRMALLRDIQLQFAPAWHTSRHVVVLNRCLLDQTSGNRTLAQFQAMADPAQIDQTLAELDCLLLTKAIEALHQAATSRTAGALLIPVSYRTLSNARWRNEYCGLLEVMPDTYRKLLILEICDMPPGVPPNLLGELIKQLSPYVKGVSLEVAIDHPDLETILAQGSWALAVNINGQSADPQVPMRLKRFAGAATAARTISLAHGANSMGLAMAAVDAGFSYVDGPAIHPTMREPKVPSQLSPLSNAKFCQMVTPVNDLAVKLLVLDDDVAVGETMALMAKRLRVECRSTSTADAFFTTFRKWQPTHIALDLAMPDFDGIEALRRLAELECEATIILVSGVDSRVLEAAHRAAQNHRLNIAGTIAKPFSLAVLRDSPTLDRDTADLVPLAAIEPPVEPRLSKPMLAKAIAAGQIDVAFQPKVRCGDGALMGFEALARWRHPKHGTIPPDRFIPLAERSGLCGALTDVVFNIALAWLGQMQRPDLTLALNLSATSLGDIELADRLAALCDEHGVGVGQIIIEVTESTSIYDQTAALDLLVRLRLKGFSLSIDDFGVGYSSLSQLARIPFSELKIDRSFITTTPHSHELRTIVKAIVGLAKNLGLQTVAEGVEDLATFGFLREIGCDQVQGYLISRPMNRDAIAAWMGPVSATRDNGTVPAEVQASSAVA